jgi:hypothetical protein
VIARGPPSTARQALTGAGAEARRPSNPPAAAEEDPSTGPDASDGAARTAAARRTSVVEGIGSTDTAGTCKAVGGFATTAGPSWTFVASARPPA